MAPESWSHQTGPGRKRANMKLCWTLKSMPELSHLSAADRKRVLRENFTIFRRIQILLWPSILGGLLGLGAGSALRKTLGHEMSIAAGAAVGIVTAFSAYQLQLVRIRVQLRLEVMRRSRGRRTPICLQCSFDLRGADGVRCPECGAPIVVPDDSDSEHSDLPWRDE